MIIYVYIIYYIHEIVYRYIEVTNNPVFDRHTSVKSCKIRRKFSCFQPDPKARKARALDIWESLKPDVEMEMSRPWGYGTCHRIEASSGEISGFRCVIWIDRYQ